MDITFVNGTDLQQACCRTTLSSFINLPADSIPLQLEISFVSDPLESMHNEFAATTVTVGSTFAEMRFAKVAPNWPEPWHGTLFLQETVAHETGHAVYGALPTKYRLAIAEMFGADTDDPDVLTAGENWEDKISEGIAETFKDAFLPPDMRRYYNRTHHKIDISEYPRFRSLVREGVTQILGGGGGGGGGEGSGGSFEVDLLEGLQDDLNDPTENAQYEARASAVQEIRVGTDFHYEMSVPRSLFPAKAVGLKSEQVISGYIQFAIRVVDVDTEDEIHFTRGAWLFGKNKTTEHDPLIWDDEFFGFIFDIPPGNVEESDDTSEGGENIWNLYAEEANSLGPPDFTIAHSFSVPAGKTIAVTAWALLYAYVPIPGEETFPEFELNPERLEIYKELMPHLIYREQGTSITLPKPKLSPESLSRSRRRQDRNRVSSLHVG